MEISRFHPPIRLPSRGQTPDWRTDARHRPAPAEPLAMAQSATERPRSGSSPDAAPAPVDYSALVRQSRLHATEITRDIRAQQAPGFLAQRALSTYAANTRAPEVELLPRVDDFV